jgi:hypothetical protein
MNTLNPDLPLELHITQHHAGYHGTLRQGGQLLGSVTGMQLAAEAEVVGTPWNLGQVVQAMIAYQPNDLQQLDERALQRIGDYLYAQSLDRFGIATSHRWQETDLRIVSEDEWIIGLPWNLLYHFNAFLCAGGMGVAMARSACVEAVVLPPLPRLLIIAPQVRGMVDTDAEQHIAALLKQLADASSLLRVAKHVRRITRWTAFVDACEGDAPPDLIYYYGHGSSEHQSSRLHFEDETRAVADMAWQLERMAQPPRFAYINCCLGDAGGLLGAGVQLGRVVPAVLTNRTMAQIAAAQQQAMLLWTSMLLHGAAPHKAVADVQGQIDLRDFSLGDIRWMTPVLHASYREWKIESNRRNGYYSGDPYWHLKIDRIDQSSVVMEQTRIMLQEERVRCRSFVWCGAEGQGVEMFHERLHHELDVAFTAAAVHTLRPRWPDHLHRSHESFSHMICEVFDAVRLEDVAAEIRRLSDHQGKKQTLIYLCHEPVFGKALMNPKTLRDYMLWLDLALVPQLNHDQYLLVCTSFVVGNTTNFMTAVDKYRVKQHELKHSVFRSLKPLGKLVEEDLETFIQTHNIQLPTDKIDWVLGEILKRSGGNYEATIEELRNIVDLAWQQPDPEPEADDEDDFDY